ncbi:MAG: ribbon-helix-helix protein, CopG family [Nocardioidaceae bacterium]
MLVVAVRLPAEELDSLDAAAVKNGISRSEAIRALHWPISRREGSPKRAEARRLGGGRHVGG